MNLDNYSKKSWRFIHFFKLDLLNFQTVSALRLKQALDDVKKNTDVDLTEECVEQEIEKVKRKYGLEFQKRVSQFLVKNNNSI